MSLRLAQWANTVYPIEISSLSITILVRKEHQVKAALSIILIVLGIETLVTPVPKNASSFIPTTGLPSLYLSLITISVESHSFSFLSYIYIYTECL